MRKTAFVIAGAIAFDLGVLVISSHAAPAPELKIGKADAVTTPAPAKTPVPAKQAEGSFSFLKFDMTNTLVTCKTKGGTPATQGGVNGCLLPAGSAHSVMDELSTTR